jgi:hypothetical protein
MKRACLASFALALLLFVNATTYCAAPTAEEGIIPGIAQMPVTAIEPLLPNAHPANYYFFAARLWQMGEKDKALSWYSIAQLRARFMLAAHPGEDPSAGPALFASLQAEVGPPIIQYAATDPKNWAAQIDAALQWDASNPNGYTSKSEYKQQWEEARKATRNLRNEVIAQSAQVQRLQMQVMQIGKMPADWPALEAASSVDGLVGTFGMPDLRVGMWLFDGRQALRATTIEIQKADPGQILVIARRGDEELVRRAIPIQEEAGAILWRWDTVITDSKATHTEHKVVRLRTNVADDLIVQTESLAEPMRGGDAGPHIFWYRATRVKVP